MMVTCFVSSWLCARVHELGVIRVIFRLTFHVMFEGDSFVSQMTCHSTKAKPSWRSCLSMIWWYEDSFSWKVNKTVWLPFAEAGKLEVAGAIVPETNDGQAPDAATVNGEVGIDTPIDENLFAGDDIDLIEDELDELELDDWRKWKIMRGRFRQIANINKAHVKRVNISADIGACFGCKVSSASYTQCAGARLFFFSSTFWQKFLPSVCLNFHDAWLRQCSCKFQGLLTGDIAFTQESVFAESNFNISKLHVVFLSFFRGCKWAQWKENRSLVQHFVFFSRHLLSDYVNPKMGFVDSLLFSGFTLVEHFWCHEKCSAPLWIHM